jgi:hypothetical protein
MSFRDPDVVMSHLSWLAPDQSSRMSPLGLAYGL